LIRWANAKNMISWRSEGWESVPHVLCNRAGADRVLQSDLPK
jgi:hypothetical protein